MTRRLCIILILALAVPYSTLASAASVVLTHAGTDGVWAIIFPDSGEIGKPANIWMGAVLNDAIYLRNGSTNWAKYQGGSFPIALTGAALPSSLLVKIVDFDISSLPGLNIYVGYGRTEADLSLSGHLVKVYTVPDVTIPTSNSSDCSTLSFVPGRVLTMNNSFSAPFVSSTQTIVRSVGPDTAFLGQSVHQAIDLGSKSTTSVYFQDLPNEWILLGWISGAATATYRPSVHSAKHWSIGQTQRYSYQLLIDAGPVSLATAIQETQTLVRRETVTVPAGTFDACVFHSDLTTSDANGSTQSSTDIWIAPNIGEVKLVATTNSGGVTTRVLMKVQ